MPFGYRPVALPGTLSAPDEAGIDEGFDYLVSWNTRQLLCGCLNSIAADAASRTWRYGRGQCLRGWQPGMVEQSFSWVHLFSSKRIWDLAGQQCGLCSHSGEYLLLLIRIRC